MKRFIFLLQIFVILQSFSFSQSNLQKGSIGDLILLSGETIENCEVGYRIFGAINENKTNIIIYPTWFGGTSQSIGSLVGKHHFIDTTKYCVISIDALGNGVSSSPSNYEKCFPQITIRDMVNAEYKLLTNILGIKHIFAAVGGSLGSMQVLEWSVAYPDFMDKVVAYVSSPKMTTYDKLWLETQINMIESCKKYGMSEKEIQKITDMMTATMSRTPDYIIEKIKPEDFDNYISSFDKEPSKDFTIDDYLVQLKAIKKHDISLAFKGSMEAAAAAIKAKLFIIVSKNDMLVNPTEALKFAELTNARKMVLDNNCGHLAVSCELERCSEEISDFFNR